MGILQDAPAGGVGGVGDLRADGPGVQGADDDQLAAVTGLVAAATISEQPAPAAAAPAATFTRFPDLPTELRLKIWHLSFAPRVVEIHRRKSHYADDYHEGGIGVYNSSSFSGIAATAAAAAASGKKSPASLAKWQSWSANPAALAVSFEARACALEHYTATIRLAVNTPCERAGEARLDLHRRLYLAPRADTLVVLGEFNVAQTAELLRHIALQDARGRGLHRLALCASSIGHPGAGILLLIYSRTIFQDLDQLVLFLYAERMPPPTWRDGHCELVDCRDTYQFRRFQVGRGAELKNTRGAGWMTVGHTPLEVLDLAFGKPADNNSSSSIAATVVAEAKTHKSGSRSVDDATLDEKRLQHVTTVSLRPDAL